MSQGSIPWIVNPSKHKSGKWCIDTFTYKFFLSITEFSYYYHPSNFNGRKFIFPQDIPKRCQKSIGGQWLVVIHTRQYAYSSGTVLLIKIGSWCFKFFLLKLIYSNKLPRYYRSVILALCFIEERVAVSMLLIDNKYVTIHNWYQLDGNVTYLLEPTHESIVGSYPLVVVRWIHSTICNRLMHPPRTTRYFGTRI